MCALRAIPVPELPIEMTQATANRGLLDIPGTNAGICAVSILPSPAAMTKHLAIIQFATEPGGLSAIHHHGEFDTGVYVLRGTVGFKCGAGMRDYVAMRTGELGFIDPGAVHAENNPETRAGAAWSVALSIRHTASTPFYPCEAPAALPEDTTGIRVGPRPAATTALVPDESDRVLGALSTHHLRAQRVALDRIELRGGEKYSVPYATVGETALSVLAGTARVHDDITGSSLQGRGGDWWYLDEGTKWSVENTSPDKAAELLLIRSAP